MTIPARPQFLVEGPASACIIGGKHLGWANCACLSTAMGIDRSTLGKVRISGCQVRRETGDTTGGTTLEQNAAVAVKHGVRVEVHTGGNVASPAYLAVQLQAGRGAMVSGNCSALLNTPHRSTAGPVNHTVWVNEVRGGTLGAPATALVYDPARNGRYGPAGEAWWTWPLVKAFAAALRPWGDKDLRVLGPGRVYCGIFPDTEPHAHLKYGGVRKVPFPDNVIGKAGTSIASRRIRPAPTTVGTPLGTLAIGAPWRIFQTAKGVTMLGSAVWYGDHDGTHWVHESGVTGRGGT